MEKLKNLTLYQWIDFKNFTDDLFYVVSNEKFYKILEIERIDKPITTLFYSIIYISEDGSDDWTSYRRKFEDIINDELDLGFTMYTSVDDWGDVRVEFIVTGNKEEALKKLKEAVKKLKEFVDSRVRIYK